MYHHLRLGNKDSAVCKGNDENGNGTAAKSIVTRNPAQLKTAHTNAQALQYPNIAAPKDLLNDEKHNFYLT